MVLKEYLTSRNFNRGMAAVVFALFLLLPVPSSSAPIPGQLGLPASGDTLARVGEDFGFIWDPEVLGLVKEIGEEIARAYRAPNQRYHIYVIRSNQLNAFITPTGDIFVFSGQLTRLHSADELAGVLAHEMAHMEADHFSRMRKQGTLMTIPALAAIILSKGQEAVVAGTLAAVRSYQLHYSREMEEECDLMAINVLKKTSYDPLGMVGALMVIEDGQRLLPVDVPDHLSTHPPMAVRRPILESILGQSLEEVKWSPTPDWKWMRLQVMVKAITGNPGRQLEEWKASGFKAGTAREHQLAGLYLSKAGYYFEAVTEYLKALEELDGDGEFLSDLGVACFRKGDYESARKYLEKARALSPENAYPLFYLAELERVEGRIRKAVPLYQRALSGRPELSEAYYRYGMILSDSGKRGEASFHLGVAAMLSGRFQEAYSLLREAERELGKSPFWSKKIEERLAVYR